MNEKIFTIEEMLPLLKEHILFFSFNEGRKKYFHYMKKNILVQDGNSRYKINEKDFKELFKDAKFLIFDPKDNIEIDLEKDKEYYSWRQ